MGGSRSRAQEEKEPGGSSPFSARGKRGKLGKRPIRRVPGRAAYCIKLSRALGIKESAAEGGGKEGRSSVPSGEGDHLKGGRRDVSGGKGKAKAEAQRAPQGR